MSDIASQVSAAMAANSQPAAPQAEAAPKAAPEAPKAEVKEVSKEAPQEPTAAQKAKWKLKADGEEFEWDPSDEEATKREIMRARGANKRFEEAAKMRKQAETFFEMLKNPETLAQVLSDPRVGVDVKQWAEKVVWEHMQEESLSPEQKRQREIEKELSKYKDTEAKQRAQVEAEERQRAEAHFEQDFSQKIMSALDMGGIPKTVHAVRRMTHYMSQAIKNNLDIVPADLVNYVRRDIQEEHKAMFSAADDSALEKILQEDWYKKARALEMKRLKSTQPEQFRKQSASSAPRKQEKPQKKLSGDEWRADLSRKLLGK